MKPNLLHGVKFWIVASALAFLPGEGYVLYREPKLAVLSILGWLLLATIFASRLRDVDLDAWLATIRRPPLIVLAAFLSWMTITRLWVLVPENYFYELQQWLLLFLFALVFLQWTNHEAKATSAIRDALIVAAALVSVVGVLQLHIEIPWLAPINPEIGAVNPSFFGYKNPAALAVLGQLFLLGERLIESSGKTRFALGVLLAVELFYLATLRSRTSYAALLVGVLAAATLWWLKRPSRGRALRAGGAALALFLTFAGAFAVSPVARERAAELAPLLSDPSLYFESDRGTYFLNTVQMVRHRPLGVGLGDWQTHYPVYRLHRRDLAFDEQFQVRRAHSDHVQFFGEGGWIGIGLWFAFLAAALWASGRERPLLSAQMITLCVAMAGDYVLDLPFHKMQFMLIVVLMLAQRKAEIPTPPSPASGEGEGRRIAIIAVSLLFLVAAAQIGYHVAALQKARTGATIQALYVQAGERAAPNILRLGGRFAEQIGHTKTTYKTWLIIARAAQLFDRPQAARAAAEKALDLHPHSSHAYRLLGRIEEDPERSRQWNGVADRILHEVVDGPPPGAFLH